MHLNQRLAHANSKTRQYLTTRVCFRTSTRNAFWSMSNLSLQMKCNIISYSTGILFNQKHAVSFKKSSSLQCPLCQQVDSAQILSGCQHITIFGTFTEYHDTACRLIMKAISKGSLAGCLVHLDAGSTDRLAQQNLQIPEHANNRTLPCWLLDALLSVRDRTYLKSP